MKPKQKRTSIELDADLWLRIKIQSAREGLSMKQLIVREVERGLARKKAS